MPEAPSDSIRRWAAHPDQMVRELFQVDPDPWQQEALEVFPHEQRIAMCAAKGPGKSALEAWLGWNFLLTRPFPKIAATSITGDTLADTLWAEMAKWQDRSPLLKSAFEWQKTRIFARDHPETWFMTARSWSKSADPAQQANTLAGLHADYILFLLDEVGGIPDAVMVAADAALSSCIEGHLVIAGNPTHLEGPLYRACTTAKKLWYVIHITGDPDDPKRSPRISKEWAQQMIDAWGRNHPYTLVNVFGEFPPSSLNALIGPDEVRAAMNRSWREYDIGDASKILGVDVAAQGDDASVIAKRQGIQMFESKKYRNINSIQGAGTVSRTWEDWGADAAFVDNTGGFGAGWCDQLQILGRAPIRVEFSGMAHQSGRYANKRVEMFFDFVEWIKNGGALPNSPELLAALTQTTYTHLRDKLILEPKDAIKAKLGYSPDECDAAMLTFAEPVVPKRRGLVTGRRMATDYDPFASMDRHFAAYDPMGRQ